MGKRATVREHLAELAYIDHRAAGRTADEMLGVIRRDAADRTCYLVSRRTGFHPQLPNPGKANSASVVAANLIRKFLTWLDFDNYLAVFRQQLPISTLAMPKKSSFALLRTLRTEWSRSIAVQSAVIRSGSAAMEWLDTLSLWLIFGGIALIAIAATLWVFG